MLLSTSPSALLPTFMPVHARQATNLATKSDTPLAHHPGFRLCVLGPVSVGLALGDVLGDQRRRDGRGATADEERVEEVKPGVHRRELALACRLVERPATCGELVVQDSVKPRRDRRTGPPPRCFRNRRAPVPLSVPVLSRIGTRSSRTCTTRSGPRSASRRPAPQLASSRSARASACKSGPTPTLCPSARPLRPPPQPRLLGALEHAPDPLPVARAPPGAYFYRLVSSMPQLC